MIALSRRPPRRAENAAVALLTAVVLALDPGAATAAGATAAADATGGCRRAAARNLTVNLSGGVYTERAVVRAPLSVTLPTAPDSGVYGDCLVREGLTRDVARDPYLAAVEDCRRESRRPVAGVAGDGVARVAATPDPDRYGSCVRRRLTTLEVEVLDSGSASGSRSAGVGSGGGAPNGSP